MEELVAQDYRRHDPGIPHEVYGTESLKQLLSLYFTAFPDLHLTVELIAEGNRWLSSDGAWYALRRVHGSARHRQGISVKVMEMFRIENGKIVEQWSMWTC